MSGGQLFLGQNIWRTDKIACDTGMPIALRCKSCRSFCSLAQLMEIAGGIVVNSNSSIAQDRNDFVCGGSEEKTG